MRREEGGVGGEHHRGDGCSGHPLQLQYGVLGLGREGVARDLTSHQRLATARPGAPQVEGARGESLQGLAPVGEIGGLRLGLGEGRRLRGGFGGHGPTGRDGVVDRDERPQEEGGGDHVERQVVHAHAEDVAVRAAGQPDSDQGPAVETEGAVDERGQVLLQRFTGQVDRFDLRRELACGDHFLEQFRAARVEDRPQYVVAAEDHGQGRLQHVRPEPAADLEGEPQVVDPGVRDQLLHQPQGLFLVRGRCSGGGRIRGPGGHAHLRVHDDQNSAWSRSVRTVESARRRSAWPTSSEILRPSISVALTAVAAPFFSRVA